MGPTVAVEAAGGRKVFGDGTLEERAPIEEEAKLAWS
jgi:hypothetical protein